MTRQEAYAKIKKYNLAKEIANTYYVPSYANLSTATLIAYVENHEASKCCKGRAENSRFDKLVELLYKKHLICKSEYNALMN